MTKLYTFRYKKSGIAAAYVRAASEAEAWRKFARRMAGPVDRDRFKVVAS